MLLVTAVATASSLDAPCPAAQQVRIVPAATFERAKSTAADAGFASFPSARDSPESVLDQRANSPIL